jgi:hypothetical protein
MAFVYDMTEAIHQIVPTNGKTVRAASNFSADKIQHGLLATDRRLFLVNEH